MTKIRQLEFTTTLDGIEYGVVFIIVRNKRAYEIQVFDGDQDVTHKIHPLRYDKLLSRANDFLQTKDYP